MVKSIGRCFICFLFVWLIMQVQNFSAETQIGIALKNLHSNHMLFQVENMKPGDWAERTVIIENVENADIQYNTLIENIKGSKKLFDALTLEVKDGQKNLLFKGLLKDFKGFTPRNIQSSKEDQLTFLITFPEQLGNEYQGLETSFKIVFQANSSLDSIQTYGSGNNEGLLLPNTATNFYAFILVGIMFFAMGAIFFFQKRNKHKDQLHEL